MQGEGIQKGQAQGEVLASGTCEEHRRTEFHNTTVMYNYDGLTWATIRGKDNSGEELGKLDRGTIRPMEGQIDKPPQGGQVKKWRSGIVRG